MNFNPRFNSSTTNLNDSTQFSNLMKQKIDFKNIELRDPQSSSVHNSINTFKINSPKNPYFGPTSDLLNHKKYASNIMQSCKEEEDALKNLSGSSLLMHNN